MPACSLIHLPEGYDIHVLGVEAEPGGTGPSDHGVPVKTLADLGEHEVRGANDAAIPGDLKRRWPGPLEARLAILASGQLDDMPVNSLPQASPGLFVSQTGPSGLPSSSHGQVLPHRGNPRHARRPARYRRSDETGVALRENPTGSASLEFPRILGRVRADVLPTLRGVGETSGKLAARR